MPLDKTIKKVLVIGSGPIVIGQSAEFDYSGGQACKALREEGVKVVLVNSNPATIQTDPEMADTIYIEPLRADVIEKIIEREKPDGIIATMGGQTGLNLAMELHAKGVFEKYTARMLGTGIHAIEMAEDRGKFAGLLKKIGEPILDSVAATTFDEAREFANTHQFPLILRPAYTLGGTGGGIARNEEGYQKLLKLGFTLSPTHQILIEESVLGWAELEYEVMRDANDNCITICNMENIDPMGVHTGESVVVAPSQTLSDNDYQVLRSAALKIIRALDIRGGCNIQFALNQETGKYVVVEVNPRLSRSSALASKATGYPIARVAAKIALGYALNEISNSVTKTTPASFEPALDYCVVKIPRWPFDKMPEGERGLGTQMKSTGEVMAIGRTFEEALQKAMRSLEQKEPRVKYDDIEGHLTKPTDLRLWAVFEAFRISGGQKTDAGAEMASGGRRKNAADENAVGLEWTAEKIAGLSKINRWFVDRIGEIVGMEKRLKKEPFSSSLLLQAKRMGFSDAQIAKIMDRDEDAIRAMRIKEGIVPTYKMVDTCAGEFEAKTPYYYSAYEQENESVPDAKKKVVVIGSGPIRIGQGIEFDYCCVHAAIALRENGIQSIMINNNPETISTDFDTSDKLYFEPLAFEDVMNIIELEKPEGVMVQFGGQTSINLAERLHEAGVKILGTQVEGIDIAEDREKFRKVLQNLGIRQPENGTATNKVEALQAANKIGYPIVVRPSYVIAGRGMAIVYSDAELSQYIEEAVDVSHKRPVLIDRYIDRAIECEIDGVCDGKELYIGGIMEHIERAGVHSGDASCVVPPVRLKKEVQEKIAEHSRAIALALHTVGCINIQYVVQNDVIFVLEANPRASRTMPFLSKSTGVPLVKKAVEAMLGKNLRQISLVGGVQEQKHFAVKSVVFPFLKLPGVDFVLGPEMKSTGESMGIAWDYPTAYYKSLLGANLKIPKEGQVVLSLKDGDKERAGEIVDRLTRLGFYISATPGTAKYLKHARMLNKISNGEPNIVSELKAGRVGLVINTPSRGKRPNTDGFAIRRAALEANVPCITSFEAAEALVEAMEKMAGKKADAHPLAEYWAK